MENVECRYMRQTLVCIVQFMKAVHITGGFAFLSFGGISFSLYFPISASIEENIWGTLDPESRNIKRSVT